ncbi:hypothetical protein ACDH70_06925 [Xanthomonas axonopodis pv. poinsettiicola]|uniref:hypothetical protein n=2 Tax=Xanthomonas TaxID=338 RepID=UPI003558E714
MSRKPWAYHNIGALTAAIAILASKLPKEEQESLAESLRAGVKNLDGLPQFSEPLGGAYISGFTDRTETIIKTMQQLKQSESQPFAS